MDTAGFCVTSVLFAVLLIVRVRPNDRLGRFMLATFAAGGSVQLYSALHFRQWASHIDEFAAGPFVNPTRAFVVRYLVRRVAEWMLLIAIFVA
jgi:hypothetical protein